MKLTDWLKSLFKTTALIGLSKIAGFLRDLITAFFFGTSRSADAFNYAGLFTAQPFILFGGLNGPFHSATVSTLSSEKELKDNRFTQEQNILISQILFYSFLIFAGLGVLVFLFCEIILKLIFKDSALVQEIVIQTKLMIPCLISSGIIGSLFGVSCYKKNYTSSSISPLISSIALIIMILCFHKSLGANVLGIATSLGVILQILLQYFELKKYNFIFKFKESIDYKALKLFFYILFPALLSSTIGSFNIYVDMFFCKDLKEGSWTALILANRLIQLPFGTLVGASLVSFLPRMSEAENKKDEKTFKLILNTELENLTFILVPATALLMALSQPFIEILLQRGRFDVNSTEITASIFFFLGLSIITSFPREIATRAFYALKNSKTPFIISLLSIGFNFLFNYIFVKFMDADGIAISKTLTSFLNSLILIFLLRKFLNVNYIKIIKIFILGIVIYFCAKYLYLFIDSINSLNFLINIFDFINLKTLFNFGISGGISLLIYLGLSYIFIKSSTISTT